MAFCCTTAPYGPGQTDGDDMPPGGNTGGGGGGEGRVKYVIDDDRNGEATQAQRTRAPSRGAQKSMANG